MAVSTEDSHRIVADSTYIVHQKKRSIPSKKAIASSNQTKFIQQRRQIQQKLYGLPQYPDRSNPVH
ncbi:hypothetical protein [Microcoleus sp. EPA2]|uniref:hypothetical protein n=1 Tax=Microcoleus sp. EPA2 TaxID=2841654 RepID=UPI00312B7EC7